MSDDKREWWIRPAFNECQDAIWNKKPIIEHTSIHVVPAARLAEAASEIKRWQNVFDEEIARLKDESLHTLEEWAKDRGNLYKKLTALEAKHESLLKAATEMRAALEVIARPIPESFHTSEVEQEQTMAAGRALAAFDASQKEKI